MLLCLNLPLFGFSLQTGGTGGFDLAGLLNNPGFMSMVRKAPTWSGWASRM